ncbi:MAG: YXWGXW repeat-containing protein, partial [Rhodospirillales bacterium]|nr:YXWGXW repeat-containing protein [Rhodospirillales bacterium]
STFQKDTGACQVAPPPKNEVIPKPPVSEQTQVWQPGHWDWDGSSYAWTPGAWVKRGGHSNQWMDGYWTRNVAPGPCHWVSPHWM